MSLLSFSLFTSKAHLPLLGVLLSASLRLPMLVQFWQIFYNKEANLGEKL